MKIKIKESKFPSWGNCKNKKSEEHSDFFKFLKPLT